MTDLDFGHLPADNGQVTAEKGGEKTPRKRGRKPGQQPKARPEIPDDEFNFIKQVAEEDRVDHKRRREDRSEKQKGIDEVVRANFEDWKAAGCPANWADMPVITWDVSPSFAEEAEFMLRKAAGLYGRKLVFGQKEPSTEYPGKITLPFCVIARPPRKERSSSDE